MKNVTSGKHVRKRKKFEFSKKLAVWAVILATACVAASFTLAALSLETASDVTTTVFTACIGYLITYAGKSLGEKVSRNRHGLDADGNPIAPPTDNTGGPADDTDSNGVG